MKAKVWLPTTSFQSDHHHLFSDASSELWDALNLGSEGFCSSATTSTNMFGTTNEPPPLRHVSPPHPLYVPQSPPGINTRHQTIHHQNFGLERAPPGWGMEGSVSVAGRGGGGGGARGGFVSSRRGRPPLSQRPTFTSTPGPVRGGSTGRGGSGSLASSAVTITQWRCRQCGKSYATRSGLYFHEATHTGQYKHTCFLCEKGFMQTNQYKTHLATHQKQFKNMHGQSPSK